MNTIGSTVTDPARLGETIETAHWSMTCDDALRGGDIVDLYPADDHRTRNLAETSPETVPTWIALHVTVMNLTDRQRYLPPTAFYPVDTDGALVLDVLTLTSPDPDVAQEYAPGESGEGWVVFQPPDDTELGDVLRFLPFQAEGDPRYLTMAGLATSGGASESPDAPFEVGQDVVTSEDGVNLRAAPSTSAEVVTVLPIGASLAVTGPPTEGDGRTWYPVAVDEREATGYVAADLLAPA